MAKTAKLKKKQAAPHSRAARRAASPSLPFPASLTTRRSTSPSREPKHHVLSAQSSSSTGISKKRSSKMSRAQRVRAEKAMERAADDMDKWEAKKKKSIEKAGVIKGRAKMWEEVNGESVGRKKGGEKSFEVLESEEAGKGGNKGPRFGFGDEEMEEVGVVDQGEDKAGLSVAPPVVEDELL